jgi:hypothetical protein
MIRLFSPLGNEVETIAFNDSLPWPAGSAGEGRTVERLNPDSSAANALNWFDGCVGGSPGELYSPCNDGIVISEINYNSGSSYPTNDWIELRNISTTAIDVSGWIFKDDNDSSAFIIPASTIINSNSNLVLTRYLYDFAYTNPNVTNVIGDFGFNLSGSGEWLRIYDASSILKISVHYSDTIPFPVEADGDGYTLELKDSLGKMNDGNNWFAGCKGGSPGKYYTDLCGFPTYENDDEQKSFFTLSPTITDYQTTLQYFTNRSNLRISFYDITGREIYSQQLLKDDRSIKINTRDWNNGLLFWNINSGVEKLAVGKLFINH